MATIDKNDSPTQKEVEAFLEKINFPLPEGFLNFFKGANGADISSNDNYLALWPLTDMIKLNVDYRVAEYAPEFFIFGSDGGDTAYVIEKETGNIFEMPFIGMSKDEAVFMSNTFDGFLESIED